jgi:hypothetical protein
MDSLKLFSEILASTDVLSVIISVIALSMAVKAYRIAKNKMRLNFYYKRMDLYSSVVKYILVFVEGDYLKIKETRYPEIYENFFLAYRESLFLFKEEDNIHTIIENIKDITAKIKHYYDHEKDVSADKIKSREENLANENTLMQKLKDLEKRIKEYIQFDSL